MYSSAPSRMDVEYKIYAYIRGGCVDATSINRLCIAMSRVKVNAHTRIPDNPPALHLCIGFKFGPTDVCAGDRFAQTMGDQL